MTLNIVRQDDEHLDHGVQHDAILEAQVLGGEFDKDISFRVATSDDVVTAATPLIVRPNLERQVYEIRPVGGDFKAGGYRLVAIKDRRDMGIAPAYFNVELEPAWHEMVEGTHPQTSKLERDGAVAVREYRTQDGNLKPRALLDPKPGSSASIGFPTEIVFATVRPACVWYELVFVEGPRSGKLILNGPFDLSCVFDWSEQTVSLLHGGNIVTRGEALAKFKLPENVFEGPKLRVGLAFDGMSNAVIALGKPKTPRVVATVRLHHAPVIGPDQRIGVQTVSDPVFVLHTYGSAFPKQLNEVNALNIMR
ncbi:MAG TPA: hypothetical protein PLH94_06655 [Fimbriimonadaceae bacterium]|nr:hypothetical protein [Fimbriimonadaceae bacterium]